jgi:RNA polymerase sigma factor (sigma-70 family)
MGIPASVWVRSQADDSPFERLFASEYVRVVSIARRVLGEGHEAEDVAQEVFCSFYQLHSPDAPYAAAWLHRAAAHTALNLVRGERRRRQRETVDALARSRLTAGGDLLSDPQRAVEADESRREVRCALSRLSQKSAAVLVLRYSGLSYAEVAAALNARADQIGTLLRRAEAALRREMTRETS